jgi:hypothetical protein
MAGTRSDRNRRTLRRRLEGRRQEIEQVALTRVYAVSDSSAADPAYLDGLRVAVSDALDYGFEALERGENRAPPIPISLLAQARIAARNGVSLDVVLRRYFAGYTLMGDLVVQEAETMDVSSRVLKSLLRSHGATFDRLLKLVTEEFRREERAAEEAVDRSRGERVKRLLRGELLDPTLVGYDFGGFHTGLILVGEDAETTLRPLAAAMDRRLLMCDWPDGIVWAWLGGRHLDPGELWSRFEGFPGRARLAVGEPGEGITGWRQTHRQAKAAFSILLRSEERAVRYGDVALLVSALQDELLVSSLRSLYLAPLEGERDGGKVARETLRAYFAVGRNVSSAAAMLGVSRQAVANRLRQIEERLGQPIERLTVELDMALRLEELELQHSRDTGVYGMPTSFQL